MKSTAEIIQRIRDLEETLVWDEDHRLMSSETKRIVGRVKFIARKDSHGTDTGDWMVCWQEETRGEVFSDLNAAKDHAKFKAIVNILDDDLRRRTIQ